MSPASTEAAGVSASDEFWRGEHNLKATIYQYLLLINESGFLGGTFCSSSYSARQAAP